MSVRAPKSTGQMNRRSKPEGHGQSRATPRIFAAGIATLLAATPTFATTWIWDGGDAGGNQWTNTLNWNSNTAPVNDDTADVIFAGTVRPTPNMNANWSVKSVAFNNTAGPFVLGTSTGSILAISAGGITNNSANNQTINHAITLFAPQTWTAVSGPLTFEGTIQNIGFLLTLDCNIGSPSVYMDGSIQGGGGLTKNGLGQLVLQAGNTYAGTTTVNAGALFLGGTSGIITIPGALVIGDGNGTAIDSVLNQIGDTIADTATVTVVSTGALSLLNGSFGVSETITNLNIISAGIPGGAVVTLGSTINPLTILGTLTMTGGTVNSTGLAPLRINGNLTTNASNFAATISSKLDLNNGTRSFTIGDGAAPNDLDLTGIVSNGGIIKNGPGTLRLGAANTYAGGTTLNAGTILIGNDAALGTGPLTGNGGTIQADGAARTIANAASGTFAVVGAFDLGLSSPANGDITKNGAGTLVFAKAGAVTNSLTVNAGTVRVDAPATFSAGLVNLATLLTGTQTLTVDGAGLNNQGSLPLAGGTLAGSGPVVNGGIMSGYGTIGGSGGFTNNAQLTISGGNLTLAKAGANANGNSGTITLAPVLQLQLTGGNLANAGTISLNGGIINGTATLNNNPGGLVWGSGAISAPFTNAGLVAVDSGILTLPSFANSGVIELGGTSATIGGGTITNGSSGVIEGQGRVSAPLTNNGTIEATGGTLILAGVSTNSATGTIRSGTGTKILVQGSGFPANSGAIALIGGTFDTGGQVLANTGQIAGRGTFKTGGLSLNTPGQMSLSAGLSDVFGAVTLNSGSKVTLAGGATATFYGAVNASSGSEFRISAGSTAVFFGNVIGTSFFTGFGTKDFEGASALPGALATPGATLVGSGATLGATQIREASLTVSGLATILSDGGPNGASKVGALAMDIGGVLDLTNNDIVIDASNLATVRLLVVTAYHDGNANDWGGPGITTSSHTIKTGLGYAAGNDPAIAGLNHSLTGQSFADTSVLVKYTWIADGNLDGSVDGSDVALWAQNFSGALGSNPPNPRNWTQGDWNYDGSVDGSDVALWAQNFTGALGGGGLGAGLRIQVLPSGTDLTPQAVPEPGGLILAIAGGILGMRRRRTEG